MHRFRQMSQTRENTRDKTHNMSFSWRNMGVLNSVAKYSQDVVQRVLRMPPEVERRSARSMADLRKRLYVYEVVPGI